MENCRILVWDLPLRVYHWSLAVSFAGAFLTAEAERYRDAHVLLGYTVLALLAFRLLWAFAGTRYARLSSFAFGPGAVVRYLKSLADGRPSRYVGHNPAGSWVIYALIVLGVAAGLAGHAIGAGGGGGEWMEDIHEGLANVMLALVVVHVGGVVASSFLHRENLVRAMLTGYKSGAPGEGIARTRRAVAIALVLGLISLWTVVLPVTTAETAMHRAGGGEHHERSRGHASHSHRS